MTTIERTTAMSILTSIRLRVIFPEEMVWGERFGFFSVDEMRRYFAAQPLRMHTYPPIHQCLEHLTVIDRFDISRWMDG